MIQVCWDPAKGFTVKTTHTIDATAAPRGPVCPVPAPDGVRLVECAPGTVICTKRNIMHTLALRTAGEKGEQPDKGEHKNHLALVLVSKPLM